MAPTKAKPRTLEESVIDHEAGGYRVHKVLRAFCSCGGQVFRVEVDDETGFAARTCVACSKRILVLDSAEYEQDASPDECECPCGEDRFEFAIGFSLREDGSIKWVSIGLRCVACGQPGVYADWKIDYHPTEHLFDAL